ncbi:permease-like cell division protein FtsX [Nocardioides sp. Bht2]|uniref:permease-like cell division protein FtsX n=1 Tax=Nocardioides sp. Bht2 TaxID=3392297 RepID=UPI0039B5ED93
MQLRYVFTELGQGLRRNLTMHVAVVLTLFVSLTLVGLGLLLNSQTDKAEQYFGTQLTVKVLMCNGALNEGNGCAGPVSDAERTNILEAIEASPVTDSWEEETQQEAFDNAREVLGDAFRVSSPNAMHSAIWVTLTDARKHETLISSVQTLPGVFGIVTAKEVLDPLYGVIDTLKIGSIAIGGFLVLAALLLVANTIRLAAFARRREISIMRLVGASRLYISLPFLLEALVTALAGVALAAGALGAFWWFGIHERVAERLRFMPWVDAGDLGSAIAWIAILGPALTVIPTLVLTRKYLKV